MLQNIRAKPMPLVLKTEIVCLCGGGGTNGKDDVEIFIVS